MIHVNADYCPQNHPCPVTRACPVGAISQVGFSAPIIDEEKCTGCGKCAKLCNVFSVKADYHKAS